MTDAGQHTVWGYVWKKAPDNPLRFRTGPLRQTGFPAEVCCVVVAKGSSVDCLVECGVERFQRWMW